MNNNSIFSGTIGYFQGFLVATIMHFILPIGYGIGFWALMLVAFTTAHVLGLLISDKFSKKKK